MRKIVRQPKLINASSKEVRRNKDIEINGDDSKAK